MPTQSIAKHKQQMSTGLFLPPISIVVCVKRAALGGCGNAIHSINQLMCSALGDEETRSQLKLSQPARGDTRFTRTLGLHCLSSYY